MNSHLDEATKAIDKANYTADSRQTVAHIGTAVEEIIAYLKQQADPPRFVPLSAQDCGVHALVERMQAGEILGSTGAQGPSCCRGGCPTGPLGPEGVHGADFCTHCGANVPPIIGEGTCRVCDPLGFLENTQLSDTVKLAELVAEVKRRGFAIDTKALNILRALNDIRPLGDIAYDIREREGEDWEGPKTVAWGIQCAKMKTLLEANNESSNTK